MGLEPLFRFANAWSSFAPGFAVHLFQGRITVADMDKMEGLGMAWRAKHPGSIVEMVIVFPSPARPDDDERKRLVRLVGNRERDRTAAATVVLADGLMGAMQRSILTALTMMRRPPHPSKVFASVADAAEWIDPHYRAVRVLGVDRFDIESTVSAMCAAFAERNAAPAVAEIR
ncbi:MAG TPA: hypothetical protein VH062_30695 [Polyangiaceae bacterium]|nr:hypothetical protein [Polyangiaceae bacterium]